MSLQLQVIPDKAIVIRRDRAIVSAVWFGPTVLRPYVFPFVGPGGTELTRINHPLDPVSHSHHRSIWVGHRNVNGIDFWGEQKDPGRITCASISDLKEKGPQVNATMNLSWNRPDGDELLAERRKLTFSDLGSQNLALDLEMEFRSTSDQPVKLDVSNFGLLGVRVARTLRVHEGLGGQILNSSEAENESGCFGQHAYWIDYSGPVPVAAQKGAPKPAPGTLPAIVAGVTCYDHPKNPADDTMWHVRDDGWMGPSLTRTKAISITRERLVIRYRIETHAGRAWQARVSERYRAWRRSESRG
ncbi:MAG: DUF6807 family protein [Planctomycetota bacterium]